MESLAIPTAKASKVMPLSAMQVRAIFLVVTELAESVPAGVWFRSMMTRLAVTSMTIAEIRMQGKEMK